MKKDIIIGLIHLGTIHFLSAQRFVVGGNYNFNLYAPYSQLTQSYIDSNSEISVINPFMRCPNRFPSKPHRI